ncbi:MAG TPA: NusA-like transcription termination signal-binding factor [Desulfobacterales bacterium]|nr:NusA-like transcription termination signal-binding factor [Desulfobacterales bacterium]
MTIKLTSEEMRYITLFEGMTGARVHDCVIEDNGKGVIFVIKKGELGLAIGKGGNKIRRARRVIGKSVNVIERFDDFAEFLKNILAPANVKDIHVVEREGKRVAMVTVEKQERGMVIGTGGKKIQSAKKLASRHYGIHDILLV